MQLYRALSVPKDKTQQQIKARDDTDTTDLDIERTIDTGCVNILFCSCACVCACACACMCMYVCMCVCVCVFNPALSSPPHHRAPAVGRIANRSD